MWCVHVAVNRTSDSTSPSPHHSTAISRYFCPQLSPFLSFSPPILAVRTLLFSYAIKIFELDQNFNHVLTPRNNSRII